MDIEWSKGQIGHFNKVEKPDFFEKAIFPSIFLLLLYLKKVLIFLQANYGMQSANFQELNVKNKSSYFMKCIFASLIIISLSPLATQDQNALAITPVWEFKSYTLNEGAVQGAGLPSFPVDLNVIDPVAAGLGSITVQISSSANPVGIELTLTEETPGNFVNTNLAMMEDNGIGTMQSTLTITIWDDSSPSPDIQTIDDSTIKIVSDSDSNPGLTVPFTETGPETNLYQAKINFGSETNAASNTLAAAPGDIFTVYDTIGGNFANGFILPNPNLGKGAIQGIVDGTVTASYQGDSASFDIGKYPGPGRGSGGLIKPGLVLDSPNGNGGCNNCQPPTLGLDKNLNRVVSGGFSFNDNPVDVELFYTPYPLITVEVGQTNMAILKIFDDGGIENIQHVGLAFGLGKGESFSESKATISWDKTFDGKETTDVYDPGHVLDNVQIITSTGFCGPIISQQCLVVSIQHMFREELLFNMVSTNVWDSKRNSWQNFYNHGIEIEGSSLNPPKSKMVAFGEKNMRGLYELTQINKRQDLWIDEFGNTYEYKGNDRFNRIVPIPKEIVYDKMTSHGCDRNCNWFEEYKLNEILLAENIFKEILRGKVIEDTPKEIFFYEYHIINRNEDLNLQKNITIERLKAEEVIKKMSNFSKSG